MPIEQPQTTVNLAAATAKLNPNTSVIENELPAYRAVSVKAIVSLVCGILSALSFADFWFLTFSVLAIVLGILAIRVIDRMPELFTGKAIAQAGIAIGLSFGLMSITTTTVLYYLRANYAKGFAMQMQDVINRGTIEDAMYYFQPPAIRKNTTPEKLSETTGKNPQEVAAMEMQFASLKLLKKTIALKGSEFHYDGIETVIDDGASLYAGAAFEVHAPEAAAPLPKEGFAFALLRGTKIDGKYEWWIQEVRYPYNREGFSVLPHANDDGHGH